MSETDLAKKELGRRGEEIALKFFIDKGYKLLHKNYSFKQMGELDLVMQDEKYLVFIEVRTKKNTIFGTPLDTIGIEKRKQIAKMAGLYLIREKISPEVYCRFDVIGIVLPNEGEPQIEFYTDAFIMDDYI